MPNGVVRVYPASGAVAMLPLTPVNDYTPTLLFCGSSDMPEAYYGPYYNTWTASVSPPSLRTVLCRPTIRTTTCSWAA